MYVFWGGSARSQFIPQLAGPSGVCVCLKWAKTGTDSVDDCRISVGLPSRTHPFELVAPHVGIKCLLQS